MGYINKKGKVVIPLVYDETHFFVNGFGSVNKNGKYGIINTRR